jgi:hypothetical protein
MEEVIGQEIIIRHSLLGGVLLSAKDSAPLPPILSLSPQKAIEKVEARWKIVKLNEDYYSIQSVSNGRYLASMKLWNKLDTVASFSPSICSWEIRFLDKNNARFRNSLTGCYLYGENKSLGPYVQLVENGESQYTWWRIDVQNPVADETPVVQAIEMDKLQITVEVVQNPVRASPIAAEETSSSKKLHSMSSRAVAFGIRSPSSRIGGEEPDAVFEKIRSNSEINAGAEFNPNDDDDDD